MTPHALRTALRMLLASVLVCGPAVAQPAPKPLTGNPLALRDAVAAAKVDAGERLADQVLDLSMPLSATASQPAVRLGEHELIRRIEPALRMYCQQAQQVGRGRTFLDGTAEVDLQLDGPAVRAKLKDLVQPWARGLATTQPTSGWQRVHELLDHVAFPATLRATGIGRPEQMLPTTVEGETIPPGWAGTSPTVRLLTSRAASADAQFRLRTLVLALPVQGGSLVSVLDPNGLAAVDDWLVGRGTEPAVFHPNGVAATRTTVSAEELATALDRVRSAKGEPIVLAAPPPPLASEGYAFAVSDGAVSRSLAGIRQQPVLPAWARGTVRVTARSDLAEAQRSRPDARERAAYQARVNALIGLQDELGRIPLANGVAFADVVAAHASARTDLLTYLSSAQVVQEQAPSAGLCEVTMEVPLERAYWIATHYGLPVPKP